MLAMKTPRIVFMGSPNFALASLNGLVKQFDVVGVVTQPNRPAGRGRKLSPPPVKILADELGLKVIQPIRVREPEAMQVLQEWAPDVIVVAAYGQILKPVLLALPPHGCVNVHASLLPRWRGAAPINAAILLGDRESGITIMQMEAGLDSGPILSQKAIPLAKDETAESLFDKLAVLGADLLVETLPGYLSGEIQPQMQDESLVTLAPMLNKQDGLLDPQQPAEMLERKVRAFNPWPGTYLLLDGQSFKVHKARVDATALLPAGKRGAIEDLPALGTVSGALVLEKVQPAGKKPMRGEDFLNGSKDWNTVS